MGQDGSPGDNFLLPSPLLSLNPLTQDFPSSPPLLKDRASDGGTLLPFLQGLRCSSSSPTPPPVLCWRKDTEETGLGGGGCREPTLNFPRVVFWAQSEDPIAGLVLSYLCKRIALRVPVCKGWCLSVCSNTML